MTVARVRVVSFPLVCLCAAAATACTPAAANHIELGTGGAASSAGGGSAGSGGTSDGSGGALAFGGESGAGGMTAVGGAPGTGGYPAAAGGTTSNGGRTTAPGGTTSTGGRTTASGGTTSTGGPTTAPGGAPGTGGRTARTGGTGSGGRTAGTGGLTSNGGATTGTTATGGSTSTSVAPSTTPIQLSGNNVLDCSGNPIVARGPEDVMASVSQTSEIDAAGALGANAMRMLFTLDAANGMTPAGFDTLLARAVAQHMLVWVSLYTWDSAHSNAIASALGGGNFYSLTAPVGTACSSAAPASCYLAMWSRQWLKDLMSKYQSHVIIDAGQEFISPSDPSSEGGRSAWATAAKTNVQYFRSVGYTNPLEVMANFQGRDLYGIVEYGDAIRAVDTVTVNGEPQTMFGWQAYWGDSYYQSYQGALLLGQTTGVISGPDAIHQFVATRKFPIEVGIDNIAGDTNLDYKAEIDQAAIDGVSWLWWSWKNGNVDCPVSGTTCQSYVTGAASGFKGAKPLTQ